MIENTVVWDVVRCSLVPTYKITRRFVPDSRNFDSGDIKENEDYGLRLWHFIGGLGVKCCLHGKTEGDGGEMGWYMWKELIDGISESPQTE